jgi:hypothetical protein
MKCKEKLKLYKLMFQHSNNMFEKFLQGNKEYYPLDSYVDSFIEWYKEKFVKGNYTDIGEYHKPKELRDLIETIAVWYELRYPSYEINRELPGSTQERKTTSDYPKNITELIEILEMSSGEEQKYLKDVFKLIKWEDIVSFEQFFNSLPWERRHYFIIPPYTDIFHKEENDSFIIITTMELTPDGNVEEFHQRKIPTGNSNGVFETTLRNVEKLHLKEAYHLLAMSGLVNNEVLTKINKQLEQRREKEKLIIGILNCALFRIVERGGNRIGPRRGFKFANEFGLDVSIPVTYGLDYSDPGIRDFINEALKKDVSLDTILIENYFSRKDNKTKFTLTTMEEALKIKSNYTEEEKKLGKQLINSIHLRKQTLLINETSKQAREKVLSQ